MLFHQFLNEISQVFLVSRRKKVISSMAPKTRQEIRLQETPSNSIHLIRLCPATEIFKLIPYRFLAELFQLQETLEGS